MKRLCALMILACFSTAALTACNTMAGAGKDVQKAGEKVEQKAEDCKDAHC
jgi:predicted small secreted protein